MQTEDFTKFNELYTAMFDQLRKNTSDKPSKMAVTMFFKVVKGVTLEQFENACHVHLERSVWMPKPAEILKIINGNKENTDRLEGQKAWQEITTRLKWHGADKASRMPLEAAAEKALQLAGGWSKLRNIREDDLQWMKKDFLQNYSDVQARPMIEGPTNIAGRLDSPGKYNTRNCPGIERFGSGCRGCMAFDRCSSYPGDQKNSGYVDFLQTVSPED